MKQQMQAAEENKPRARIIRWLSPEFRTTASRSGEGFWRTSYKVFALLRGEMFHAHFQDGRGPTGSRAGSRWLMGVSVRCLSMSSQFLISWNSSCYYIIGEMTGPPGPVETCNSHSKNCKQP